MKTEAAGADVDHQHAGDRRAVLARDQRDRAMLFEAADAGPRPDLLHQAVDDLDAGEVALVHGAVEGLSREGLAVQRAVRVAVEEAADLVFQFGDALDRLRHQRPGEFLMRQPLAALDRVHEVALDRVAAMQRDVVAALHHAGAAAFAEQALGGDGDVELRVRRMRMQRGEQAGAAAAEDQNVGLAAFDRHQNTLARKRKATTAAAAMADEREPRLAAAPREIFQHQQPQAAEHVHGEQADEQGFGELHQRLIGPAQEALQPRFARDRKPEREEMKRQEDRQREPGQPVDQRRDPERAGAMRQRCSWHHHGDDGAKAEHGQQQPEQDGGRIDARERGSGVHSVSTVRTPIDAWIAIAATNTP